jgi:hypothetical protein
VSEVTDLVLPILQRMQADLADVKRVQAEHSRQLEDIEIHLAYATGIASQNKFDVTSVKTELAKLKRAIEAREPQP